MAKLEKQNNQNIRGVTHGHIDAHQERGKIIQEVEERKEAYVHEHSKKQTELEKDNPENIKE